jgi:hypothetical protein
MVVVPLVDPVVRPFTLGRAHGLQVVGELLGVHEQQHVPHVRTLLASAGRQAMPGPAARPSAASAPPAPRPPRAWRWSIRARTGPRRDRRGRRRTGPGGDAAASRRAPRRARRPIRLSSFTRCASCGGMQAQGAPRPLGQPAGLTSCQEDDRQSARYDNLLGNHGLISLALPRLRRGGAVPMTPARAEVGGPLSDAASLPSRPGRVPSRSSRRTARRSHARRGHEERRAAAGAWRHVEASLVSRRAAPDRLGWRLPRAGRPGTSERSTS